jgi:hypothetical protein
MSQERKATGCENETISLTCEHEPNLVIKNLSAYYGRHGKRACNPEHKNFQVDCFSKIAPYIIRNL